MAGGFFKGAILGGLLSVSAAMLISVLMPLKSAPQVADRAPVSQSVDPVAEAIVAEAPVVVETPQPDPAPQTAEVAAPAPAPQADTVAVVEAMETPAAAPEASDVADIDTPATTDIETAEAPTAETPVFQTPQALAPMAPQGVDEVLVSTEPAQLPTPQAEAPETALALSETVGQTVLPGSDVIASTQPPAPLLQTDPEMTLAEPAPAEPLPTPVAEAAQEPETETPQVEIAVVPAEPETETADTAVAEAETPAEETSTPVAEVMPAPQTDAQSTQEATAEADTETGTADETVVASVDISDARDDLQGTATNETSSVRIGKPAVNLVERSNGVKINRSPGVNRIAVAAQAPTETSVAPAQTGAGLPVRKFANAFDNPTERPLMSIVLIDTGQDLSDGDVDLAALGDFPYPLSFAVDAGLPDATERMARYREDGFEVLAMIDLPEGAAPADAEVTMSVMLDRLPEAIGVLEGLGGGFQGSREVSDQVTEILLQSGHGLVSQSQGLNTMPKLARKLGVPAKPIFRDFDSKNQDARVIRRFLDQAAFKADQEGGVIMLGRLRPETIKALLVWGLADRASQVALAPVSAVLLRD